MSGPLSGVLRTHLPVLGTLHDGPKGMFSKAPIYSSRFVPRMFLGCTWDVVSCSPEVPLYVLGTILSCSQFALGTFLECSLDVVSWSPGGLV